MNFMPREEWSPLLPAIAWRGHLIAGFNHSGFAIDQSGHEIADLFRELYPSVSLVELARIYRNWTLLVANQNKAWIRFWPKLQKHYGFKDSENFRSFLIMLLQTPLKFQEWISQKNPSYKELSILTQLEDISSFKTFLVKFEELKLSRSEGCSALELAIEVHLIQNLDIRHLLPQETENKILWLQRLRKLRFPNTDQLDRHKKNEIEKLSLPQFVRAKWTRIGDESGVELKFLAKNSKDLENKLNAVKRSSENNKVWQDL